MNCFTDTLNKIWNIELNVGVARRVNAECGVNFLDVMKVDENGISVNVLQELVDDPYKLISVLCSLCRKQMEDSGIDEEAFAERFNADTVEKAVDALVKEVINFSQPLKRKMLTMIYTKANACREKAEKNLEEMLESKEFSETLDRQLNGLYTNTPESLE